MGFLDSSAGKESAGSVGDLGSIPGSGRSSGEVMATTPVFLPGEFHGQRSLVSYRILEWVAMPSSRGSS